MASSTLLFLYAAFSPSIAQYSPFTELSSNAFAGVSNPTDNFGPEDKLVVCDGILSFIDLDNNAAVLMRSLNSGRTWSKITIANAVCDDGSNPLIPRNNGYKVNVVTKPTTGSDRIIILGGDSNSNNVYYSDDCGRSFACSDNLEYWDPREYSWLVEIPGIQFPYAPVMMGGGYVDDPLLGPDPTVGMFTSGDGGITWQRPLCTDQSGPGPTTGLPGSCGGVYGGIEQDERTNQWGYVMPDAPSTPGMIAVGDWPPTLWYFNEFPDFPDMSVWYLNESNYRSGWSPLMNAQTDGMFGRKVWIQGATSNVSCWFSTDYGADDMYLELDRGVVVNSMNSFSVAKSAAGPWVVSPLPAPWAPRAGAVVAPGPGGRSVIIAAGMSYSAAVPSLPSFGDVWRVDAGVCLLNSAGLVCNGNGRPNLDTVTCICDANYAGNADCSVCTPGITYTSNCTLCPVSPDGAVCNSAVGGGVCDSSRGCVCRGSYSGLDCSSTPAEAAPTSNVPVVAGVTVSMLLIAGAGLFAVKTLGLSRTMRAMSAGVIKASQGASRLYRVVASGASTGSAEGVGLMGTAGSSASPLASKTALSTSKLSSEQAASRFGSLSLGAKATSYGAL